MSSASPAAPLDRSLASVIIVNWRQPELTARSVRSLDAQDADFAFEVVVVDNESTPASRDALAQSCPNALIVPVERNSGFAGGVTAGIAAARTEVLVLLNNDAEADPGFLRAGVRRLLGEPAEVAAVAARVDLEGAFTRVAPDSPASADHLVGLDGSRWRPDPGGTGLVNSTGVQIAPGANGFDRDWLRPSAELDRGADDDPFGFSGAAVFLRRSALTAVGGFDESYFMYYEDLDLSWRLRLTGRRIAYEPTARVVHRHAGSSSHSSSLIRVNSVRNRWLTVLKNGSPRLVAAVTLRTGARLGADLGRSLLRRDGAFLAPGDWLRVVRDGARRAPRALAARNRAAAARTARRAVESRYFTGRS
jgi:GT2 family glycosyltransferase